YLISALLLDFIIRLQFSPTLPVHHTPFSFFFTAPPTPEFYTLSLHDALPISVSAALAASHQRLQRLTDSSVLFIPLLIPFQLLRSEEHTSELQSQSNLVCRLLLEKKKHQSFSTLIYDLRLTRDDVVLTLQQPR